MPSRLLVLAGIPVDDENCYVQHVQSRWLSPVGIKYGMLHNTYAAFQLRLSRKHSQTCFANPGCSMTLLEAGLAIAVLQGQGDQGCDHLPPCNVLSHDY